MKRKTNQRLDKPEEGHLTGGEGEGEERREGEEGDQGGGEIKQSRKNL